MALDWTKAAEEAASFLEAWREDEPGGVVLGFDAQGARFVQARGLASLEHGIRFGAETPTRLASITKHLFCAVALRQGWSMRQALGELLPRAGEAFRAVPLDDALGMTGGLPDLVDSFGLLGLPATADADRDSLLRMALALPGLNFPPGSSISYSNTGYRLAESALPARFDTLLEQHFPGLGFFYPEDESDPVPGLATGYWRDAARGWRRGRYGVNFSASGGLACSAEALMRWSQRLMRGGDGTAGLWAALTAPRHLRDGQETGYGLGLARAPLGDVPLWGHGGSLPGYKNHVLMAPDLGLGIIVLSNREETGAYRISLSVMAALLGTALPPPARLPEGLFAQEDGPFWLESTGDTLALLGAAEPAWQGEDGTARCLQPHLAFSLRPEADGSLSGTLAHRPCRLLPVSGTSFDNRLNGRWAGTAMGMPFALEVGEGTEGPWITLPGQPAKRTSLRPLGPGKALAERLSPPSRSRFALWLTGPDELRLVSQRSRVLTLRRG